MSSKLVSLHWRAANEPKETEISATEDPYLSGVVDLLLPKWREDRTTRCKDRLRAYEDAVGLCGAKEQWDDDLTPVEEAETRETDAVSEANSPAVKQRKRRITIFNGEVRVRELPQEKLEEFFQARAATFDISARKSIAGAGVTRVITDAKHLQIIDILIRKAAVLRHPKQSQKAGANKAVDELVQAVKDCDYDRLEDGTLEDLRKVTAAHLEDKKQNVLAFVESRGEEALQQLEHSHLHRLLYGLLCIPSVPQRFECMMTDINFNDNALRCHRNLQVLMEGLACVREILEPLGRIFAAALRLGNALNLGSSAPVAGHGFRLCALSKLLELRSPVKKEISLLHYTLLWVPEEEVEALCDPDVLDRLQKAQASRTQTVYMDLVAHLESFQQIQTLVKTGQYKGQEIARQGDEDAFFQKMATFVKRGGRKAEFLQKLGIGVFDAYMKLGAFLGDLKAVYPPPAEGSEEKKDLLAVLFEFLSTVRRVLGEVRNQRLAQEVERLAGISLPFTTGLDEAVFQSPKAASEPLAQEPTALPEPLAEAPAQSKPLVPAEPIVEAEEEPQEESPINVADVRKMLTFDDEDLVDKPAEARQQLLSKSEEEESGPMTPNANPETQPANSPEPSTPKPAKDLPAAFEKFAAPKEVEEQPLLPEREEPEAEPLMTPPTAPPARTPATPVQEKPDPDLILPPKTPEGPPPKRTVLSKSLSRTAIAKAKVLSATMRITGEVVPPEPTLAPPPRPVLRRPMGAKPTLPSKETKAAAAAVPEPKTAPEPEEPTEPLMTPPTAPPAQTPETPVQEKPDPDFVVQPKTPKGPPPPRLVKGKGRAFGGMAKVTFSQPEEGEPPAVTKARQAPPPPASWVLGAPPLNIAGLETFTPVKRTSPTAAISPPTTRPQGLAPMTPQGLVAPTPTRTPLPQSTPDIRQARKSLTKIADRVVTESIGHRAASSVAQELEEAQSGLSPLWGEDDDGSSAAVGLYEQISREVYRRKSRGRSGHPFGSPSGSQGIDMWALLDEYPASPATPAKNAYALTPVKEKGETPYRLATKR